MPGKRSLVLLACSLYLFLLFLSAAAPSEMAMEEPLLSGVRHSIVKITAARQSVDFLNPWLFSASQGVAGSGFYIGSQRIMTNAHVVSNARFITVQKDGDSRQYNAFVEFIGHDCDLAILKVREAEFFAGLKPLVLGDIPLLRSPVSTVGYPTGGEQIAVTKGIVSRIDYSVYVHTDYHYHLLIQVDSAINSGASGGPVLQKGKVVGVAFQAMRAGENIGYIIPVPVIKRFLNDISSGTYRGHPEPGFIGRAWVTDNEGASRFYGVREGYLLTEVTPWSAYKEYIHEGDILLEIDGQPIGPDGNIKYYGERVSFFIVFDLKQVGDDIKFKLKRGEQTFTQQFKIQAPTSHPFTGLTYKKHPRYISIGGLVFTELSQSYLATWGEEWIRKIPLFFRYVFSHSDEDPELVHYRSFIVLAKRLPHEINQYADRFQNAIVQKVNGKDVHTFDEFQHAMEQLSGKFLHIEFFDRDEDLYLPIKDLKENQAVINESYGVQPSGWFDDKTDGAIPWEEGK